MKQRMLQIGLELFRHVQVVPQDMGRLVDGYDRQSGIAQTHFLREG